jgi:crotonobetainyl-CoA:carnitine CoA-transferase CaiB-like acyl-CoA transferase
MTDASALGSPQPFSDLVVVELGHSVAAPFTGQIFADLGAEVIKVEKSDGDDARKWGPPFWDGAAAAFQTLNRNKRSVVCDLRSPADREALIGLIRERTDVVIQNLRPGQVEKLGLDAASLRAIKPSLIYCNFGAFGNRGPLRDRPGYDPLMQAFGGIMSTTGEPGRPAVRVGPSIVDMGTGMWAVIGILAALRKREATGEGSVVDVSLFETAAAWVSILAAQYLASGESPTRQGSGAAGIVPYKAYRTRDGELVVAAGSDGLFRRLAEVVGHPEWVEDPRFVDNPARVRNQEVLYAMLDEIMLREDTATWVEKLEAVGIPCSPVQTIEQMIRHPQTEALGLVQPVPDSELRFVGLPLSLDGARPTLRMRPPRLGEHTGELLKPAGSPAAASGSG